MSPEEIDQTWTAAYGLAFAITALGGEIRGNRNSPEDIDARAQKLADKATETIAARVKESRRRK